VHLSTGHIDFGELDGRESERAKAIAAVFPARRNPRPARSRYHDAQMGQAGVERRAQHRGDADAEAGRRILDDPESMKLLGTLMKEIVEVARAEGAQISDDRIDAYIAHSQKNLRGLKPRRSRISSTANLWSMKR